MAWIRTIPEMDASAKLADVYRRAKDRSGKVPNITRLQSLRPESLERSFDLYCQLMDAPTGISKRERVLIATVVSKANGCLY